MSLFCKTTVASAGRAVADDDEQQYTCNDFEQNLRFHDRLANLNPPDV